MILCYLILTAFLSEQAVDPHNDMGWFLTNKNTYAYTWFEHNPNRFGKKSNEKKEIRYLLIQNKPDLIKKHTKPKICVAEGVDYYYGTFTRKK